MSFSPPDPASAYSLWLQLRNTKQTRRRRWRSDWGPLWMLLLLLSLLSLCYAIMPSNDVAEPPDQKAFSETALTDHPVETVLGRSGD